MGIGDLSLFSAIKQKMHWHQTRQVLLAENVANAETPGYRGRDLAPFEFAQSLKATSSASMTTTATNDGHFSVSSGGGGASSAKITETHSFEVTPEGNAVVLEDEMMKVTANQMDYQAVTTLYAQSLKIIRTALGRSA